MNITIYMGSQCNLDCAYCHREKSDKEPSITPEFLEYLKGIDGRIGFMGGEPTLYMDDVKKIVDAAKNAHFSITTNGVLLDKYIEYFREHDFLICLSYDGNQEGLRAFDPFQKLIDYPKLAVSCTLFHGNTDFHKIIRSFTEKEKIIGRTLSFFPHLMHHTNPQNKQFELTEADYDEIFIQYKECLSSYIKDAYSGVRNLRYEALFKQMMAREKACYIYGETYCSNGRLRKCDLSGQAYSCFYIREDKIGNDWLEIQQGIIKNNFPSCLGCSVYDMCGAGCIKSLSHEAECRFYKKLYTWFKSFRKTHLEIIRRLEEYD